MINPPENPVRVKGRSHSIAVFWLTWPSWGGRLTARENRA